MSDYRTPVKQGLDTLQEGLSAQAELFFGNEALDPPQQGLRFVEEAIELCQVCAVGKDQLHQLVDFVYDRPIGDMMQEIGGSAVGLLVLAAAVGVNLHQAMYTEADRFLAFDVDYYIRSRNRAKNAAGFKAV